MKDFINWLAPYSSLFETLSFLSTIILVIVSIFALRQLDIAKKSLKTAKDTLGIQSQRDSRRIAAEYVYIFKDRVMGFKKDFSVSPERKKILDALRYSSDDHDGLDVEKITLINPEIKLDSPQEREAFKEKLSDAYLPYAGILNELEAFSAAVASGILDEKTIYRAVGQYYTNLINEYKLDQILYYLSNEKNLYTNVAEIYLLWSLRIAAKNLEKVEKQNSDLSEDINEMKIKIGDIEERAIHPIGVQDEEL